MNSVLILLYIFTCRVVHINTNRCRPESLKSNVSALEESVKSMEANFTSIHEMMMNVTAAIQAIQITQDSLANTIQTVTNAVSANIAAMTNKCDVSICTSTQTTADNLDANITRITRDILTHNKAITANSKTLGDNVKAIKTLGANQDSLTSTIQGTAKLILANTAAIQTHSTTLANKCDASTCTAIQTGTTKLESKMTALSKATMSSNKAITANEQTARANERAIQANKDSLTKTIESTTKLSDAVSANTEAIQTHSTTLANKCDASTCTEIQTSTNKLELLLNPVVLLTGGHIQGSKSSDLSVEVFSLRQNGYCSKNLDDLPDKRRDHTINFLNGKILLCGGQQNPKTCLSLDENQRFIPHSQLNQYRYDHVGAVINDELLLAGRRNTMQMESWNGSQWVTHNANLDEIKEFEINSCMDAISKDTILMAGGGYDNGYKLTNKMLKYKNGVWERMEDYPGDAKTMHGCAFIRTPGGDAFLIAGGTTVKNNYQRSSYLYNIGKRQWEEVGQLTHGRAGGKVLNVGGRIIMVGGSYGPLEVEEYDVYTKTWKTIPEKIKQKRGQFDAVVVPGSLVGC